jgi:predicted  nucleic acid-binding Zn-ribbon protein
MAERTPFMVCLECGKKFYTNAAAERAVNNGCPNCDGVDIDLYVPERRGLAGANVPTTVPKEHPMA